jgi:hypothetical protein
MSCPIPSSPEFVEMSNILGDKIAYDVWAKNGGMPLSLDFTGKPSAVYEEILAETGSTTQAIISRASLLSNSSISLMNNLMSHSYNEMGLTDPTDFSDTSEKATGCDIINDFTSWANIALTDFKSGTFVTDSVTMLEYILQTKSLPKYLIPLAKMLLPYARKNPVQITSVNKPLFAKDGGRIRGLSSIDELGNQRIIVSSLNNVYFATMLHEMVHAYVKHAMSIDNVFNRNMQRIYTAARSFYNTDPAAAKNTTLAYGFTSVNEFTSEMLSNYDFINYLQSLPAINTEHTSLWQWLIDTIHDLFGVKKSMHTNLYLQASDELTKLLEYNAKVRKDGVKSVISPDVQHLRDNNPQPLYFDTLTRISSDSVQKATIAKFSELATNVKHGIKSRIQSLKRQGRDINNQVLLQQLLVAMNTMDDARSVFDFAMSANKTLVAVYKQLYNVQNNRASINRKDLISIKTDVIDFYRDILSQIGGAASGGFFTNMGFSKTEVNDIIKATSDYSLIISAIESIYSMLIRNEAANIMKRVGLEAGSTTSEDYVDTHLDSTDMDINKIEQFVMSASAVSNEGIRMLGYMIQTVFNSVRRKTIMVGRDLLSLSRGVNHRNLYEYDENGNRTGYIIRDKRYGKFNKDWNEFRAELRDEFGLTEDEDYPLTPDEFIEYRKRENEWLKKNAVRRYVDDYYDTLYSLSLNATIALKNINGDINSLLVRHRNANSKKGKSRVNAASFSNEDWAHLQDLYRAKRNLANTFDLQGRPKTGIELDVAIELQKFNKTISNEFKYITNDAAFEEARLNYLDYTNEIVQPELYDTWINRNTEITYTDEFWDELSQVGKSIYGDEYQKAHEARRQLLSMARDDNSIMVDKKRLTKGAVEAIEYYDKLLSTFLRVGKKQGKKFTDVAKMVPSERYLQSKKAAKDRGVYQQWFQQNHYQNANGKWVPYSYHMNLVPVNPKHVQRTPSRIWSEISVDSSYYNKDFNDTIPERIQPKNIKKYDNSRAFNSLSAKELALRQELIDVMSNSYEKLTFRVNPNPYKLPQISGSMWAYVKKDGVNGIRKYLHDEVSINADDVGYANVTQTTPAGEKLYFVPTYYMRELPDVNQLTWDLVGSVIEFYNMAENYKQMSDLQPKVEIIKQQHGNRRFRNKNGLNLPGTETNVYKRMDQMIRLFVYGEQNITGNTGDTKLSDNAKTSKVSATKLMKKFQSYFRIVNLAWNQVASWAGVLTSMAHAAANALVGNYYTKADFAFAIKTMLLYLPSNILNIGNPRASNKLLALMENTSISSNAGMQFKDLNNWRVYRAIKHHLFFGSYSAGDFLAKGTILTAVYHNYRLVNDPVTGERKFMSKHDWFQLSKAHDNSKAGQKQARQAWRYAEITLWDAVESVNGIIEPKEQYKEYVTDTVMDSATNLAQTLASRADGQLNDIDKGYLQTNVIWGFFVMHRAWMLLNFQDTYFKKESYNYMTGQVETSLYNGAGRTIIINIRESIKVLGNALILTKYSPQYQKLSDASKVQFKLLVASMLLLLIFMFVANMWSDDADKKRSTYGEQYRALMARRLVFELWANYNPREVIDIIKSPSAATSTFENGVTTIMSVFDIFSFNDDPVGKGKNKKHPSAIVKRGAYKGMTRFERSLIKATPYKHFIEIQDPNAKRRYIENML